MTEDKKSGSVFAYPFWIALGLLGFIFSDTLIYMAQSWQREEYSHGYMIPLLSLILTLNAMKDAHRPAVASATGAVIMGCGILLSFAVRFAGINGVSPQIFLISLWGLFLLFWGMKNIRPLAAPLGILFFCAPLPKFLFYRLSFDMQMTSSSLGTFLLGLFGVSVFQDGNIIDLGGYKLEVAEACNGIRYLFPLLGLSFLLGYMYKAQAWKRVLIFVSAVPITIFMNALRIALIGITVDQWGAQMAEGLIHELEGWVVFVGCFGLLLAEIALLQKIGSRGIMRYDMLSLPSLRHALAPARGRKITAALILLVICAALSPALTHYTQNYIKPVPLAQPLSAFPMQIGDWAGEPQEMDPRSLEILGTTEYLLTDYHNANAAPVNLYVLYYPQQDSTSNQGLHSPSICIPAGGWTTIEQGLGSIRIGSAHSFTANRLVIAKGNARELIYYWFVHDGAETWSPNLSKLMQIENTVTKGRSDGAMIRLSTPIQTNETPDEAAARLTGFAAEAGGTIYDFLGWPPQTK